MNTEPTTETPPLPERGTRDEAEWRYYLHLLGLKIPREDGVEG